MKKIIVLIISLTILIVTTIYKVNLSKIKKENLDNLDLNRLLTKRNEVKQTENDMLAYTCSTCQTIPSSFPQKGEGYNAIGVTCTNGATAEWDNIDWDLDFENLVVPTTCTIDFMESFVVSLRVTNGIVSSSSTIVEAGGNFATTITPNNGYAYHSDDCGAVVENNTIKINNVTSDIICNVKFKKIDSLYKIILSDNPNVESRETFDNIFTTSNNGNTIYYDFGQDVEETYYFAGSVTNNYVYFAGNYWRIVRINEDSSVRLIYAGAAETKSDGFLPQPVFYNKEDNMSYYVGYKYSTTQHGNGTDSTVKAYVDTWYNNTLNSNSSVDSNGNKYDAYVSRTAIYCNDRNVASGSTWSTNSKTFYFASYPRLAEDYLPTFVCSNSNDRFTVSSTTGNAKLTYPVALITADEVAYAGGGMYLDNESYYLHDNAWEDSWWTMTPSWFFKNSSGTVIVTRVWEVFAGMSDLNDAGNTHLVETSVRPVLSLKSCVEWTAGNGTKSNPYKVSLNSSCIAAEN